MCRPALFAASTTRSVFPQRSSHERRSAFLVFAHAPSRFAAETYHVSRSASISATSTRSSSARSSSASRAAAFSGSSAPPATQIAALARPSEREHRDDVVVPFQGGSNLGGCVCCVVRDAPCLVPLWSLGEDRRSRVREGPFHLLHGGVRLDARADPSRRDAPRTLGAVRERFELVRGRALVLEVCDCQQAVEAHLLGGVVDARHGAAHPARPALGHAPRALDLLGVHAQQQHLLHAAAARRRRSAAVCRRSRSSPASRSPRPCRRTRRRGTRPCGPPSWRGTAARRRRCGRCRRRARPRSG